MKKPIQIAVLISATFSAATAEAVEGSMDCTVTSRQLTYVENGKVIKYSGIEGTFVVGDKLRLFYGQDVGSAYVKLVDMRRDKLSYSANLKVKDINAYSSFTGENTVVIYTPERSSGENFNLGPDYLISKGFARGSLAFYRYYKSDWQGMLSFFKPPSSYGNDIYSEVVTFDCRTLDDKIAEVMDLWLLKHDKD